MAGLPHAGGRLGAGGLGPLWTTTLSCLWRGQRQRWEGATMQTLKIVLTIQAIVLLV